MSDKDDPSLALLSGVESKIGLKGFTLRKLNRTLSFIPLQDQSGVNPNLIEAGNAVLMN